MSVKKSLSSSGASIYYVALPFFEARTIICKKVNIDNVHVVSGDTFDLDHMSALLASQSLFESPVIVFNDILTKDRFTQLKPVLALTTRSIVFCESADAAWKSSAIESLGGEIIKTPVKKAAARAYQKTYAFDVGTALLEKDKKNAWLLYHKALANDELPEMIHNAVWWTIKQLVLPNSSPRLSKYKKSYDAKTVADLALWWTGLLHISRKQNNDLRSVIEKAILEI